MPGLDPGIHTEPRQTPLLRLPSLRALMDRRVKPGDDTTSGAAPSHYCDNYCAALMPSSLPVSAACAFCLSIAAANSAALPGFTT
jgi:hypothetical protein